jgi:hypothetical protein
MCDMLERQCCGSGSAFVLVGWIRIQEGKHFEGCRLLLYLDVLYEGLGSGAFLFPEIQERKNPDLGAGVQDPE